MDRSRHLEIAPFIRFKCKVNVFEGGWYFNTFGNTETKSHCFVVFDVRVLPNNNYIDFIKSGSTEGIKDHVLRGETLGLCVLSFDVIVELFKERFVNEMR